MPADPIPVRAHLVLCLLGFRGEGYSPSFVEVLTQVERSVREDPEQPLRLLADPGRVCAACPHLAEAGCTLGGPAHEAHMQAQDLDVLARLGLEPGSVHPWRTIRERVASRIGPDDLPGICTTCPWLPLGYCQAGVAALREAPADRTPGDR